MYATKTKLNQLATKCKHNCSDNINAVWGLLLRYLYIVVSFLVIISVDGHTYIYFFSLLNV